MAKQISNPALTPSTTLLPSNSLLPKSASFFENSQILHLFEFEIKSLDGLTIDTLRLTDNELFITIDSEIYTPISISFDEIREDFTLQADQVQIIADNIDSQFTNEALTKEWRNNQGKIYRVVYNELPQSSQEDLDSAVLPNNSLLPSNSLLPKALSESFETGIFSFDDGYPSINFDKSAYLNRFNKDLIFDGLIDDFKGGSGRATLTLTSVLSMWDSPYPAQTFDQGQHKNIIATMTNEIPWGA